MKAIWKYQLQVADQFTLTLPSGAQRLRIDTQNDYPILWALVETAHNWSQIDHTLRCVGTGRQILEDDLKRMNYWGTAFCGPFVWHFFEEDAI